MARDYERRFSFPRAPSERRGRKCCLVSSTVTVAILVTAAFCLSLPRRLASQQKEARRGFERPKLTVQEVETTAEGRQSEEWIARVREPETIPEETQSIEQGENMQRTKENAEEGGRKQRVSEVQESEASKDDSDPRMLSGESPHIKLSCNGLDDPDVEELLRLSAEMAGGRGARGSPFPPLSSSSSSFEEGRMVGGEEEGEGPWREERVVDLIRSIVRPRLSRPSPYEYDVCMTTVVRNEYYLKEFLVRNILAGFQKIFLYDDAWGPGDTKVANLVRPFVKAGVVQYGTRDRCERARKGHNIETVNRWYMENTQKEGKKCMWIMRLDSDEIVYPMGYPSQRLPEWLEEREGKFCEIRLNWLHPYSGGPSHRQGFSLGETLLQSYPNACFQHGATKHLIQLNNVTGISSNIHRAVGEDCCPNFCLNGLGVDDSGPSWSSPHAPPDRGSRPLLVHYYTKSLADFVVKKEQSLGPYWREFKGYYDGGAASCALEKRAIPFAEEYVEDVVRVMSVQFTEDPEEDSGGKSFARPIMTAEEAGPVEDYKTYVFVKEQLSKGKWFNQTCYYEKYPEVAQLVEEGNFADATYYFVSTGFSLGKFGCWQDGPEVFLPSGSGAT